MELSNSDVFIYQASKNNYSSSWDSPNFAEGEALKGLNSLVNAKAGYDLFKAITPGKNVVVKPNLLRDWHPDGENLYSVITHPSVIRAVVDQIYKALQGEGKITIADAPMGDTNFDHLISVTGLDKIADYYWKQYRFEISLRDLRKYHYHLESRPGGYNLDRRTPLPGDPDGYCEVDLGPESAFNSLMGIDLLVGTDVTRRNDTIGSHSNGKNSYLISRTILNSDVLISLPKLKVHSKVGISINCKGMVGINGDKNLLPHFRWGNLNNGGDQFPPGSQKAIDERRMRLGRLVADKLTAPRHAWSNTILSITQALSGYLAKILRFQPVDPINGDWPGNDTCWRLAADLIRVAIFASNNGELCDTPKRSFISIVDGIIGGEGNGPLRPVPKPCGVLIAGFHPVSVDLICAHLMGFDYRQIQYLYELIDGPVATLKPSLGPIIPNHIHTFSNHDPWNDILHCQSESLLNFIPPKRWDGHIELNHP